MSDNPLADWLRQRHEALDETAADAPDGFAAAGDRPASWPGWAATGTETGPPQAARWDHPPERDGSPQPRRRRVLLLLAVLPWLVAGGLAAATLSTAQHPATSAEEHGTTVSAATPAPALAEVMNPAFGAAAVVAVRLSVTTSGDAAAEEQERRYVDLAVAEEMRWHGDVAVVTVKAVILEGPAERWRVARAARFAVPVGLVDGETVVLDTPWVVSPPDVTERSAGWQTTTADAVDVATAAAAVGYTDAEVLETTAHPGLAGVLRAQIRAHAPGEQGARDHQLWLRTEPEPAVLGD